MSALITQGSLWSFLKPVLDGVVSDTSSGKEKCTYDKWVKSKPMNDAYEDVVESGGPSLLAEKDEGSAMEYGVRREGYTKRFTAITYALQMAISHEAAEDKKYEEAVMLTKSLRRAAHQTIDLLCTSMISNGFDSNFPLGDGLSLFNAAHTIPNGSTYRNLATEALSPSTISYGVVRSAVRVLPDHAGIRNGSEVIRVLCPFEQEPTWEEIVYSKMRPDAGNFAAINIVNRDMVGNKAVIIPLRFWDDTTTRWCVQTDADHGACLYERKKPTGVSWVDDSGLTLHEGIFMRIAFGVVDARSFYGVNA